MSESNHPEVNMETPDYTAPAVATGRDSLRRELMAIARGDGVTDRERIVLGAAIGAIREADPSAMTPAAADVLAERRRQIEVEGWTPEHDDEHGAGAMSIAAACYALEGTGPDRSSTVSLERLWQWSGWASKWWKPKTRRQNLIRAAALLLAEIERLDRKG